MKHKTKIFIGAGCIGLVLAGYAAWACLTGADSACLAATIKHRHVILIIGLLASLGVGGFGALLWLQQLRSYGAALIATAAILPGAAALTTVLIFLTTCPDSCEGIFAPFWGSGIAFLAWAILAMFCLRFADARYAIPSSFGELRQRLDQLKSQLKVVCPADGFPDNPCKQMAFIQANKQVEKIKDEFEQRGMPWALARGYINVWTRLHRAEEAMIEFAPKESIIAGALNDVLRLQGSQIDHADDLIARLGQAIAVIDPSAGKYLQGVAANPNPPVTPANGDGGGNIPPAAQTPPVNTNVADASCETQAQARTVLRDVRNAINEFRDGRWNGLIVARNRLIATMIFTGMTAYLLLTIAIIAGAKQPAITGAATFYLVGATIGLLNQLHSLSQSDTAVEDYGLSTARLITMPLFCGLAAIGGVFLMAMPQKADFSSPTISPLTITTPAKLATGFYNNPYYQRIDATGGTPPYHWSINGKPADWIKLHATGDLIAMQPMSTASRTASFTASSTAAKKTIAAKNIMVTAQVKDSTGASVDKSFFLKFTSATPKYVEPPPRPATTTTVQPLADIYDLHKNLIGLLLAAVFGLTPGLLFDRLHKQDEKVKADLKSSEAAQAKPQAK